MSNKNHTSEKTEMNNRRGEMFNAPDELKRYWDRQDTERAWLYNRQYIDVYLLTGEAFVCELLELGVYVLVVNIISEKSQTPKKAIIRKEAVKYIVIKDE